MKTMGPASLRLKPCFICLGGVVFRFGLPNSGDVGRCHGRWRGCYPSVPTTSCSSQPVATPRSAPGRASRLRGPGNTEAATVAGTGSPRTGAAAAAGPTTGLRQEPDGAPEPPLGPFRPNSGTEQASLGTGDPGPASHAESRVEATSAQARVPEKVGYA